MRLEEMYEKKMELMKELVTKHIAERDERNNTVTSDEELKQAIRNCQDTISDDEVEMDNLEYMNMIEEWLKDSEY